MDDTQSKVSLNKKGRKRKRDQKLLFQFVTSITLSINLYLFDHSLLVLHYFTSCYLLLMYRDKWKKGNRKRMSGTLITRSLTVIMTHLSTAPDPNSSNTGCRTSIRVCICLWVSITALIPGGIRHIFQCGAIKTPGESWNRWTTCRKICRDGRPGQERRIRCTCMHSLVLNDKKGRSDFIEYDVRKCQRAQQNLQNRKFHPLKTLAASKNRRQQQRV